ncbi:MAG: type II toxin-antitoxin system HipA family toxin [Ornithinimicrobium sp.]
MTELTVYVDIDGAPVRAGIAYFTVGRKRVSTSFIYDSDYLANPSAFDVEPALPRQSGQQYVDKMPGSFQDSSPDRWGRNLINKRRQAEQRAAGSRRLPALTDIDYLVGVSDATRQGDLRFTHVDGRGFLDAGHAVPKLISLPKLLNSADKVAQDRDDMAAVKALLEAGSGSLGGARPKASVQSDDGVLLIAKFPHRDDEWDVMAWETWALDVAEASGIQTPARSLADAGARSVLLLERFDRRADASRVGYVSAMTLLNRQDGDEGDYLDIAEVIPEVGARVNPDLRELYRRIVFNVAIHNTDDHLRNHGFLRAPGGWRLSPIFDVNPHPDLGRGRTTSIGGATDVDDEPEALWDIAGDFRLRDDEAREVIGDVIDAMKGWRDVAAGNRIESSEQNRFQMVLEDRLGALHAVRK